MDASRKVGLALVLAVLVTSSCRDWDRFDPRLGGEGGGDGGAPTTTLNGGSGGTGATGGDGGTPISIGGGADGGGGRGGEGGEGGQGGGPGPLTIDIVASLAACANPANPDTAACQAEAGQGLITVDEEISPGSGPRYGYLRFDLDAPALAGKTVVALEVVLVVPSLSGSESDQSGEMWEVESFDATSLEIAAPATVGAAPLVADQGAVATNAVVTFTLPADLVAPGESLFVALLPVSTNGVDYFDTNGTIAPKLTVAYE